MALLAHTSRAWSRFGGRRLLLKLGLVGLFSALLPRRHRACRRRAANEPGPTGWFGHC